MTAPLLPDVADPVAGPFWAAAREGRIAVQRCLTCGLLRYPPLVGCPDCLGRTYEWQDLRPTGTVWSFAVYHRALHAAFAGQTPYTVAVVELDDGPRITGRVAGGGRPVVVGDRVRASFEAVTDEVTLIQWHLEAV